MAKKLMRRGPGLKTPQLSPKISKFSDEAKRTVTSKTPVRRIQVSDPARALTNESVAKQFTNNPNLLYQPTGKLPAAKAVTQPAQSVKTVKVPKPTPPSTKGHGKEIQRIPKKIEQLH